MRPAVVTPAVPAPHCGLVLRPTFGGTGAPAPADLRAPTSWSDHELCTDLGHDLRSPRIARHVVREHATAAGLPQQVVQVAVLLTSEVVSNAVRHASGLPRLTVDAGEAGITVGVGDDDDRYPVLRVVGLDAQGGRGIDLLDRLADAWGVIAPSTGAGGKVVWFELHAV